MAHKHVFEMVDRDGLLGGNARGMGMHGEWICTLIDHEPSVQATVGCGYCGAGWCVDHIPDGDPKDLQPKRKGKR